MHPDTPIGEQATLEGTCCGADGAEGPASAGACTVHDVVAAGGEAGSTDAGTDPPLS